MSDTPVPGDSTPPATGRVGGDPRHDADEPRVERRAMLVTVAASIAVALIVVLLVATGVIGGTTNAGERHQRVEDDRTAGAAEAAPQRPEIRDEEVEAVVAARSRALAEHNVDAFVAPIDPTAGELIAEQRRLFANLALFPFAEARYTVSNQPPRSVSDSGRAAVMVVVSFVHRVEGVDPVAIAENYRWTFDRTSAGGPLWMTAVSTAPYGGVMYPMPWDQTALVVERRPHVVLAAAVANKAEAATWADKAEAAARRDLDAWRGPRLPVDRFVVYVTPDRRTFDEIASTKGRGPAAGVCVSLAPLTLTDGKQTRQVGCRVVVDGAGKGFATSDDAIFKQIVEHELGHAMVAGFAPAWTEHVSWVAEGFAESLPWSDPRMANKYNPTARAYVNDGRFTGRLPVDGEIHSADPATTSISYHLSMQAIRFLAEEFGTDKAHTFVAEVYRDASRLDAALTAATGLDRAAFERTWARYVKDHPGS
ncbi:hypothetical protein ACIRL2_27970 [Embleya sp. NPDC127516]|uniref:hypothetical protein n=1 Tax=Embleya sp. NPDC127516 TaxID=3363990 RepID=UPI00381F8D3C